MGAASVAGGIPGSKPGRAFGAGEDGTLTITSFGGTFQKTVESEIVRSFERKTNSKVSTVTGIST